MEKRSEQKRTRNSKKIHVKSVWVWGVELAKTCKNIKNRKKNSQGVYLFFLIKKSQCVLFGTTTTPIYTTSAFYAGRLGVSGGGSNPLLLSLSLLPPTRCSPVAATWSHLCTNNSWLSGDLWTYIEPANECTAFPTNQFRPGVANHVSALT